MTATWRDALVAGAVMALAACGGADEGARAAAVRTADGVEYRARSVLLASYPVRLRTEATVMNRGGREVTLQYPDDCVVLVRMSSREGRRSWDQGAAADCTGQPVSVRLAPGDSARFDTEITALQVLGDSLPDDVYVLTAYLRPVGGDMIVLDAGRANLVVPGRP